MTINGENDIPEEIKGLLLKHKYIPMFYLYDKKGSDLFTKITKLPEYYLTMKEYNILKNNSQKIAEKFLKEKHFNMIELGSGNGEKTKLVINSFLKNKLNFTFIPIDISPSSMDQLKHVCGNTVKIQPIINDYIEGLKIFYKQQNKNSDINLITFFGSSIGNFHPEDSNVFLRKIYDLMKPNDLFLIGMDMKKDVQVMYKAYNDSQGIIGEFLYNLLIRMNNEFGANFNINNFKKYTTYNPNINAIENWLMSKEKQEVYLRKFNLKIKFEAFEFIKTSVSIKYSKNDIYRIAKENKFEVVENYCDDEIYFTDSLWKKT